MSKLRSLMGALVISVGMAGGAMAQDDDLDQSLDGKPVPIQSDKYNGGDDDDDGEATNHGRYRDPYGRDRRDDRYDPYRRGGYGGDSYGSETQYSTIYCRASGDFGGRRFCRAPSGADRIYFDRRRSDAPCREGRDYGIDRGGVWVDNGCRADFTVVFYARGGYDRYGDRRYDRGPYDRGPYDDRRYGGYDDEPTYISCESKNNRYTTCRLPSGYRDVRLSRVRSDAPCQEGRDWGTARGGVWVDNGCRATFAVRMDNGRRYSGGW